MPNPANPQNWNKYSYVSNNPLRYTDPTGHMQASDDYEDSDGKCGKKDKGCNDVVVRIQHKRDKERNDKIVKNLNDLAIAAQDLATIIDAGFGAIELSLVAVGCVATSEVGCVEGASGGMLLGQATFNVSGGNAAETGLGVVSLVFTVTADVLDDNEFGEATTTSLVTFGMGTSMMDPLGDLLIDGYASGYNHGFVNGIETIFNGGPLFR